MLFWVVARRHDAREDVMWSNSFVMLDVEKLIILFANLSIWQQSPPVHAYPRDLENNFKQIQLVVVSTV